MKNISLLLASIFIFPTTTIGDEIDYSKISEASSARIEKILVRYTRLFGEPCANIQILTPGDWQVIETERICSFNGLSFETDFADAYFSDPKFSSDGVHLHLSLTPLEPTGEQKKKCFIPIKNKHIGTIECIASD
jgi:hypothetical protein